MRPSQPRLRIDERQQGRHAFAYEEHDVDFRPLDFPKRRGTGQASATRAGEPRHRRGQGEV